MIYQSKHFSPPNAIKYILKHLQNTFQLIIYHTSRFTHQNAHCSKYITTFQKTIRLIADNSLIWHFRLPIKTLFAYQRNQIYSEAASTQFSAINLSYFTIYPLNSSLIQINHKHFRKLSDFSLNTIQFDTLRFTNQNTSHPPNANKYILKHLQHTFQLLIYHTLVLYPSKSSLFQYITTFQKTIRLIADNSLIWQFRLPIKTLLAYQRN